MILVLKGILTIFLPTLFWEWGNIFLLAGLIWYGVDYGQMSGFQHFIFIICGIMSVINLWKEIKDKMPMHRDFSETMGDGLIGMYSKFISIIAAMILLVASAESVLYGLLVVGGIILVYYLIAELRLMPEKKRKSEITVITPGEENLHTLQDFKLELESRNLMAKEGLLYGIDEYLEKNRKADVLSFTEVPEKKYPAYVYIFSVKDVNGNNIYGQDVPEEFIQLMNIKEFYFYVFYANGQITVAPATCNREFNEISIWAKKVIFTETERIYVYDIRENKYKYLTEMNGVNIIDSFEDVRGKFKYTIQYPTPSIAHIKNIDLVYIGVERVDWENIIKFLLAVAEH